MFQSDDIVETLQYVRDHPGVKVYNLDNEDHRAAASQIGKYMAPRDRERVIVPQFNPHEGKAGRFGSPRETLLKDRKAVTVLPPPRDVTPKETKLISLVRHLLYGTPLIGEHKYTCDKCGYEATACPCSRPQRREREAEPPKIRQETSDLVPKKQSVPYEQFVYELRRKAGLEKV